MIHLDKNSISGIYVSGKSIKSIYRGTLLLWEAVRSCFGKGFWLSEKPWSNDDAWKTN